MHTSNNDAAPAPVATRTPAHTMPGVWYLAGGAITLTITGGMLSAYTAQPIIANNSSELTGTWVGFLCGLASIVIGMSLGLATITWHILFRAAAALRAGQVDLVDRVEAVERAITDHDDHVEKRCGDIVAGMPALKEVLDVGLTVGRSSNGRGDYPPVSSLR